MLQPRGEADFALEPLGAQGAPQVGMQNLERDIAPVAEVTGEIDRGHSARAQGAHDLIFANQGLLQLLGKLHDTNRMRVRRICDARRDGANARSRPTELSRPIDATPPTR